MAINSDKNLQLIHQAQQDALTGFFDESFFTEKLEQVLQAKKFEPIEVTLALLQLENFYEIRTWVGKSEANLLLRDIARVLNNALPPNVLVCRCPHYEFALLLSDECSLNAVKITERLKIALRQVASSAIPPQLELKCGVGLATVDDLTQSADVLLARARHNLSQFYYLQDVNSPNQFLISVDKETVLDAVKTGLKADSFRLFFQPIVSLQEDQHKHYEIRCSPPLSYAGIPATTVFEFAVLNGFGERIDRWVIQQAVHLLQSHQQEVSHFTINLSQNSLVSAEFMSWLTALLGANPLIQEKLVFQVSEIDVLTSQHHMTHFCDQLDLLEIKLGINHFGCTPDPFRYLPLLTAKQVKLDVSLLERINESASKRRLLTDTVTKVHNHELNVVAGMIEQMISIPELWRAKVNFVQGNCFQAPAEKIDFHFNSNISLTMH